MLCAGILVGEYTVASGGVLSSADQAPPITGTGLWMPSLVLSSGTIGDGSVSSSTGSDSLEESPSNSLLHTLELPPDAFPEFILGGVAGLALFRSLHMGVAR